ncbi:MAG TPA: hypothetical protein VFK89_04165 [Actinomycetota bacterium]|nr:hypothetical protein [Actinomycetota bacterium]
MPKAQEFVYAFVGAGDAAIEKVTSLRDAIADRDNGSKIYSDFVTRGRALSKKIKGSAVTKQALAQTKTARAQVKGAATSVGKAVRANAKATRNAATKVAKAS